MYKAEKMEISHRDPPRPHVLSTPMKFFPPLLKIPRLRGHNLLSFDYLLYSVCVCVSCIFGVEPKKKELTFTPP